MITDSVGEKGRNYPLDVARVQKLINQNLHFLRNRKPLVVDGVVGIETIAAIIEYQKSVLKMKDAIGCIEPNRTTIKWLLKTARKPRPQHIDTFIIKILPAVKKIRSKYQIPVSILLAQAALDSEWGRKIYSQSYYRASKHNEFRKPVGSCYHYDTFVHFTSIDEAAENFGHFLKSNPKYLPLFSYAKKPLVFAKKLQEIGASDLSGYACKLYSVITRYHLTEFDRY